MRLLKDLSWNLLEAYQVGETLWTQALSLADGNLPASRDIGRRALQDVGDDRS
jgi:hypothetical protein